jgi:hypothetical protein
VLELVVVLAVLAAYGGLTALYRANPLPAVLIAVTLAAAVTAGTLSWVRRRGRPVWLAERLARGVAAVVVVAVLVTLFAVAPIVVADLVLDALTAP